MPVSSNAAPELSRPTPGTIRVLHVASGHAYGGIETFLAITAQYRKSCPAMEPVYVLCFEGQLAAQLRKMGAEVLICGPVRAGSPLSILRARARLRHEAARISASVVICHGAWVYALLAGALARSYSLAFFAHGILSGRHWTERLARFIPPSLALCNSLATQQTIGLLFPQAPSAIIHPPVAQPRPERDRAAVRREFSTDPAGKVIVQVSRMEEGKGHASLLDALAAIVQREDWTAWIIGGAQTPAEHRYAGALQERSHTLGIAERVRFTGEQRDVAGCLAAADIFCQPNVYPDGFGITYIEALYAGLPVITSALGEAPRIIDSSCGFLIPPGDTAALTAILKSCLANPELRLSAAQHGPARAVELCDPVRQLHRLYEALYAVSARAI